LIQDSAQVRLPHGSVCKNVTVNIAPTSCIPFTFTLRGNPGKMCICVCATSCIC
jgi:hypothetical protein